MTNCKDTKLLGGVFAALALLTVTGCSHGPNLDQYKSYPYDTGAKTPWAITYIDTPVDSNTEFKYIIHVAFKSKNPDYSFWTTSLRWKPLTQGELKARLGVMTRLIPHKHYLFYELVIPKTANSYMEATGVGAPNETDTSLVDMVMYTGFEDSPVFLTTAPVQLASIQTDQTQQTVTLIFKKIGT